MIPLVHAYPTNIGGLTSVFIAKGGFQLSGGMIFAMPYLLPSGAIFLMYSIGSRNSSSVGLNVIASGILNTLVRCETSGAIVGCPLRSTVDKSSGSARRADSGIAWLLPDGGPFSVPGAVIGTGLDDGLGVPSDGPAVGDPCGGAGVGGSGGANGTATAGVAILAVMWR